MPAITTTTRVAALVETVFQLATDLANAPGRVKGIKKLEILTDAPVGVGTRFRETRVMFGKEATEEMEITAFEPNRSYTVGCQSCGARYISDFRFEPDGDGTRVTLDFQVKPTSVFAWLMMPLGWLMMGSIKKCIQQDLDDIKAAAESAGQVPS